MCVQCMMGAMTAGAGASGARVWLATRGFSWLTPVRLKRLTIALVAGALALSTLISGSSPQQHHSSGPAQHAAPAGR